MSVSMASAMKASTVWQRIRRLTIARQLGSFGVVGVVSTIAYYVLYVALREPMGAQGANLASLLITAIGNTAANRRFTFGVRGSKDALKHHVGGLFAFAMALGLSAGALGALHTWWTLPSRWVEVALLIVANVASTVLRFVILKVMLRKP